MLPPPHTKRNVDADQATTMPCHTQPLRPTESRSNNTSWTIQHIQRHPMMDGPPMRLLIDTQATVPGSRLGVPVPIGEPVTWCHRMVICAKKNGKKLTIPNHLTTKQDPSPRGRKNLYSMHGMDITAYHFTQMTDTIQPSSHLGVATDTEQPHLDGYTRRYDEIVYPITQSVWMMPLSVQLARPLWPFLHHPQPREI